MLGRMSGWWFARGFLRPHAGTAGRVLALAGAVLAAACAAGGAEAVPLENFDDGQVTLQSYDPAQDQQPSAWELDSTNTHDGSPFALRLYGNSWKAQAIAPYPIAAGTVLRIAVYVEELGEMQAFGISDGVNTLFYTVAGTQLPTDDPWIVAYQGAFPNGQWNLYDLPVGRDWNTHYGYLPTIQRLVYVNDRDGDPEGVTLFDSVLDVTADLPIAPIATIVQGQQRVRRLEARMFEVGIQFHAQVDDPDSETHTYEWDFGDGGQSASADPFHTFLVTADHTYTVRLGVEDPTGLWGRDSAQVRVDPGEPGGPVTMNFVGDVMLARRYEDPGGVIHDQGVEAIFVPTRPYLGDAADVSIANLESPLTDEGEEHPTKLYVFRGSPENVAGLTYAGIDLVSLGNNHIIDYGQRGMEETQEVLDAAGIRWCGAGDDEYLAGQPAFWSEKGTAVAFLGMCNRTGREYNYQPFLDAATNKPGFFYLIEPNLASSIASVRDLADLVVVQMHAGIEYDTDPGRFAPGAGWLVEPPFDAPGPVPGAPDFRFRTAPTYTDRELRWRAVDEGADLVICHHPHVLQGFEVYQGVLIAHSLGNFAFDQTYVETFPSVILTTTFDKEGFLSFTFRPVFLDDMIPRLATGRLGREILDRMAEYSRALDTTVGVDPVSQTATIHTDPAGPAWVPVVHERTAPLEPGGGAWVSPPIERDGYGTLSRILEIDGAAGAEVRVGREMLWHGGFEAEGATLWNLNSGDEVYDESVSHTGHRSLRQHRTPGNAGSISTELSGNLPTLGGAEFSLTGWVRTQNAGDAGFSAQFFENRSGGSVGTFYAGDPVSGTTGWTWRSADFQVEGEAHYFNVRCSEARPNTGDGYAWFDDLRLIEWEAWQPAALPLDVPYPSNLRFLQVRSSSPGDSVRVRWEELEPAGLATGVEQSAAAAPGGEIWLARPRPNPARGETVLEFWLSKPGEARLTVYDVTGRRVQILAQGMHPAGRHRVRWQPEGVAAGLYLCRLETAGTAAATQKLVVLR
jgi:poly-gamma-glutamate capsule biosynthesis protein CapA/YwtB (metallophosphatase superfamily)